MSDDASKPAGRPSDYTEEKAAEICARIADGQSVREICRSDDMPGMATVFRWLGVHESFREQYARACEARAHFLAEDLLDIADDGTNDWMERKDEDGAVIGWRENGEALQRSRLRVDTRKWLLSKLQPKKYGDRVQNEHTGADGKPLIPEQNPEEIARHVAFLLARAANEKDDTK